MKKEKYIIYELHTLKKVKEFETEKEAKDYKTDNWKRKRAGEIINGVYYIKEQN